MKRARQLFDHLFEANEVKFTARSGNTKTGPIPTTMTEPESCPDVCPLKAGGCYAKHHFVGAHWKKVAKTGMPWDEFTDTIAQLPPGQIWRHNVAGDLPGRGNKIDRPMLAKLVKANKGKMGYSYSHKDLSLKGNRDAIKAANKGGFTINLSANSMDHADELKRLGIGPVAVVLPSEMDGRIRRTVQTPAGNKVVICPATYRDDTTCQSCKLCARPDRSAIIGFPAHGTGKSAASKISRGPQATESRARQLVQSFL